MIDVKLRSNDDIISNCIIIIVNKPRQKNGPLTAVNHNIILYR